MVRNRNSRTIGTLALFISKVDFEIDNLLFLTGYFTDHFIDLLRTLAAILISF